MSKHTHVDGINGSHDTTSKETQNNGGAPQSRPIKGTEKREPGGYVAVEISSQLWRRGDVATMWHHTLVATDKTAVAVSTSPYLALHTYPIFSL